LWRCLVYVDLNMVRAGVVSHPSEWKWSGYHEIQNPKTRYRLIDHERLKRFLNMNSQEELAKTHHRWVESYLVDKPKRQEYFSNSIAVGSRLFIERMRQKLKTQALGRRAVELPSEGQGYQLKEEILKYGGMNPESAISEDHPYRLTNAISWEDGGCLKPTF
jgi:putative transposase